MVKRLLKYRPTASVVSVHSVADEPGTTATLSYRGTSFGRAKRKNRDKVAEYEADGRIELLFESTVSAIDASSVTLDHAGGERVIPNDAVIVCAGDLAEAHHDEEWDSILASSRGLFGLFGGKGRIPRISK